MRTDNYRNTLSTGMIDLTVDRKLISMRYWRQTSIRENTNLSLFQLMLFPNNEKAFSCINELSQCRTIREPLFSSCTLHTLSQKRHNVECSESNSFSTNTKFYFNYSFRILRECLRNFRKLQY